MADDRSRVGLIGLGLIGTALARRLCWAGFSVVGFDVAAEARDRFAAIGTSVDTIGDVARTCARVLIAVFNTEQVEAVIEGGLLAEPEERRRTRQVINFSTCDPDRMISLAQRAEDRGLSFLETPLSGASDQVARGEAVCLVGGSPGALEDALDIITVVAARHYFMGGVGNGGKAKLATNLILGLNRAALAEGLVYAERLGLPLDAFFEEVRNSAAYSAVMDVKGGKMLARDFRALGKIVQSAKDFGLILKTAESAGQCLPFASVYAEMMDGCIAAGEGEWDNAAIVENIRRLRRPR